MTALTETRAAHCDVPLGTLSRPPVGSVMRGDVILDCAAQTIRCGEQMERLAYRQMMLLHLEWCRPGFVTDRMLRAVSPSLERPRTPGQDGAIGTRTTISALRGIFHQLGCHDSIVRECWGLVTGYRLVVPVTVEPGALRRLV